MHAIFKQFESKLRNEARGISADDTKDVQSMCQQLQKLAKAGKLGKLGSVSRIPDTMDRIVLYEGAEITVRVHLFVNCTFAYIIT